MTPSMGKVLISKTIWTDQGKAKAASSCPFPGSQAPAAPRDHPHYPHVDAHPVSTPSGSPTGSTISLLDLQARPTAAEAPALAAPCLN